MKGPVKSYEMRILDYVGYVYLVDIFSICVDGINMNIYGFYI